MDIYMEELFKELYLARKKKGLTQSALARSVGLPQGHISSIEKGKIDLKLSTFIQIARLLDYEVMLVPRPLMPLVQSTISGQEGLEAEPRWQPDQEEE